MAENALMDATERLMIRLLEQAGGDTVDIPDQAKALESAMRLMALKHKIVPEQQESDFDRALKALDD